MELQTHGARKYPTAAKPAPARTVKTIAGAVKTGVPSDTKSVAEQDESCERQPPSADVRQDYLENTNGEDRC
jgi:hypothetical protein